MASEYPHPSTPQPYAQTSTLALISVISGILSWFALPVIGGIIAVITGHMARREIRESLGRLTGDNLATVGLVLGYVHLGFSLIGLCILALFIALGFSGLWFCVPFSNQMGIWTAIPFGF